MNELRLLHLINGLGPGGAERSLAELLPYFLADGIRPVVVCLRTKRKGVEAAVRGLGCEIHVLPTTGLPGRVTALRRMALEQGSHLIHTTLAPSDLVGRLAAIRTEIPVLTSLVNTTYERARRGDPNVGRFALWANQAVDGWTARNLGTHFHAITEAVKESAIRALGIPPGRITVVHRGRERSRLGCPSLERRRIARERLGIANDAEVVVNVGRQEYQKGQKHLLAAAAALAATRPRVVILIAGREGHATRELCELRGRLRLGETVRFLGHREDVPEILAAADVFAFPSIYEGLGGAAIEAMALGLPIVASDIPALREILEDGENAILVKPESVSALARALAQLLDDRALASRCGKRSLEIFRERFTIERSAAEMINLYRRLGSKHGVHCSAQSSPENR